VAQGTIWSNYGDNFYDGLGYTAANAGDVNGDGIDDVLVGAPLDDDNGQECGMARVFDGVTGNVIFTIYGDDTQDELGWSVAGLGDLNGDGRSDFAIGSPNDDLNGGMSGTVRVYSGGNGSQLFRWDGAVGNESFGTSVSSCGDLDGDGVNDLLIGSTQKGNGASTLAGNVGAYSGATGLLIYTANGINPNDQFGWSLDSGHDLDGDGVNDWVTGHYGMDQTAKNAGAVSVHSGATGTQIWIAYGDSIFDHLGMDVALIGDLDGDGVSDVVASADEDDNNGTDSGSVRVFCGVTGAVITTIDGETAYDKFGTSVSSFADLNADGKVEFLVGANKFDGVVGKDAGKVYVIDGANFSIMMSAEGIVADDAIGDSVCGTSDLNGDGLPDFISGGHQRGGAAVGNGNGVVRAYDSAGTPPPPPVKWPNLPSAFNSIGAGFSEDFEAAAGVVQPYMAVNELESILRGPDADAWCNIGQNAMPSGAHGGTYCLEMGGIPSGMSSHHEVSNGLVIGLDGTGTSGLVLDYWVFNYGEENQSDDGIWVSNDGTNWEAVQGNWGGITTGQWIQMTNIDLTTTSVNTSTQFYLLFAQEDNYEFASADGIAIDDIEVHMAGPSGPTLAVNPNPPTAGQALTLSCTGNAVGDMIFIAYSLAGGGPTQTAYGMADLTPPFAASPALIANSNGDVSMGATPPAFMVNRPIWLQALNRTQSVFSNGLNFTFQ